MFTPHASVCNQNIQCQFKVHTIWPPRRMSHSCSVKSRSWRSVTCRHFNGKFASSLSGYWTSAFLASLSTLWSATNSIITEWISWDTHYQYRYNTLSASICGPLLRWLHYALNSIRLSVCLHIPSLLLTHSTIKCQKIKDQGHQVS